MARGAGAIAAVVFAARGWLAFDGDATVINWDQRSLTAMVGVSIAPARL